MNRFLIPVLRNIFSQFTWEVKTPNKSIYLTFDDGPEPGVTPRVLSLLHQYKARATFFCLGHKLEQYPDLISQITEHGNVIGNHGYYHFNGFKTPTDKYVENFEKGANISRSNLFRPPYGRITPWQSHRIKPLASIILWSAMSLDFSKNITPEKCVHNVLKNAYPGAIIVFHDSTQASPVLLKALPEILKTLSLQGFSFETLY